jgi:hypothetical protein
MNDQRLNKVAAKVATTAAEFFRYVHAQETQLAGAAPDRVAYVPLLARGFVLRRDVAAHAGRVGAQRTGLAAQQFTDRFVERSVEFFKENYRQIAWNQVNLATNVFDIFYKCLAENPQYMNFVQTTDVKNGVLYVKEKKKDSNRQLSGEAEFIKYMDGFEKAGLNIGHAINQAFNPLQTKFEEIMKIEFGQKPVEENYDDEDEYENALNDYKEKTGDIKRQLLMQVFNTIGLFENKGKRLEILSKTKRAIADGASIE